MFASVGWCVAAPCVAAHSIPHAVPADRSRTSRLVRRQRVVAASPRHWHVRLAQRIARLRSLTGDGQARTLPRSAPAPPTRPQRLRAVVLPRCVWAVALPPLPRASTATRSHAFASCSNAGLFGAHVRRWAAGRAPLAAACSPATSAAIPPPPAPAALLCWADGVGVRLAFHTGPLRHRLDHRCLPNPRVCGGGEVALLAADACGDAESAARRPPRSTTRGSSISRCWRRATRSFSTANTGCVRVRQRDACA